MKKSLKVVSLEQLLYDVYNQEEKEREQKERKNNLFIITSNINKYGLF